MADNWIQAVDKEMDKKGTKGAFTKQAKRAGMSVHDFAMEVKNNPSDYSETTRRRGQFALNMEKIADDRKKKKMAEGGEISEAKLKKMLKDDDVSWSSDKEFFEIAKNRGFDFDDEKETFVSMKTYNEGVYSHKDFANGGTTQGYNDKLDEDLGSRLGRESRYSQSLKDRRDESKAGNKTLGRRAYSSVGTMDKDDRMMLMEGGEMEYKHGGKTQGYDDKDRESIGERNKGKKSQSLKSRMDESAGMEKSMGRRKYADVSTMDKGDRKKARGGSVEGKIDRDRYVKLRRDKEKEIKKLKKEKGVLRKEAKDCDKTGVMPKVSKNENQEVMLLSAIAGIFFGAFLSK